MKSCAALLFILSFFISPNILYMAGVPYSSVEGSAIYKIHPVTYVFLMMYVVAFFSFSGRWPYEHIKRKTLTIMIFLVFSLVIYCILTGSSAANPAVTFLTPLTLYYILQRTSLSFRAKLGLCIRWILALNALQGIVEAASGNFLLIRIAGDVIVQQDTRAMGFIGHPLSSAMMSGLMLIYVSSVIVRNKVSFFSLVELILHAAALLAFGGRLALVTSLVLASGLFFFGKGAGSALNRRTQRFLRRALVLLLVVFGVALASNSDFAQSTIDRFVSDDGAASTQTRFSALTMLQGLTPSEWIFGVSLARREVLQSSVDSEYGIESTWISWIFTFGIIWAIILSIILFYLLYTHFKRSDVGIRMMSIFFIIAISGAQGLGGKNLTLCWFLVMLICFDVKSLASKSSKQEKIGIR